MSGLPDPKPIRRVSREAATRMHRPDVRRAWREAVLDRDQGCCVHPNPADCAEGFVAHHVIPQGVLRRKYPELLWSDEVGVCLCGLAHRQFHARTLTIFREQLPLYVWMRCTELDPFYMARWYPARFLTDRDPGDEVAA